MKSRVALAVAVVLSLGLSPIVTPLAAMGYGGGGGGGGYGGSYGGSYGGGSTKKAAHNVKTCKKGQVLNKATHSCVNVSHKTQKAYRPAGMY